MNDLYLGVSIFMGASFCTSMGFIFGAALSRGKHYEIGYDDGMRDANHVSDTRHMGYVNKNDAAKNSAKMGAVPEFIAPGELAEVVELNPHRPVPAFESVQRGGCLGCRYAGRYLVPGNAAL